MMATKGGMASVLLLLLLSCLAASCAGKSKCPARPPTSGSGVIKCKTLIVGAGPGGLFSAYFLRELGSDLCVVERNHWIGGRMLDFPAVKSSAPYNPMLSANAQCTSAESNAGNSTLDEIVAGTCGLRVDESQMDLRCLANQLDIVLEESDFESRIYSRGQWAHGSLSAVNTWLNSTFSSLKNNFAEDGNLADALLKYALVVSTTVNPLTNETVEPHPSTKCGDYATVQQYLQDAVGAEATAFMWTGNSFHSDWLATIDVCQYIEFFKAEWDRCCTNFYPRGGFSAIYRKMTQAMKASGVRFYFGTDIDCLYETDDHGSKYVAVFNKSKAFVAERMIVNAGQPDITKFAGPLGAALNKDPHMTNIHTVEVVIYNALWPSRWWDMYQQRNGRNFRPITDSRCTIRSEFLSHPYVYPANVSRPIYCDDPNCIAQWKAIYAAGGKDAVRAAVMNDMRSMFPLADIPEPYSDLLTFRKNGWHFVGPYATKKNITIASIAEWAQRPLGKDGLCMVGESYYIWSSAWAHGPFRSAVNCLNAQFKDVMPAESIKEMDFIASGCDGAESFDTELMAVDTKMHPDDQMISRKLITGKDRRVARKPFSELLRM